MKPTQKSSLIVIVLLLLLAGPHAAPAQEVLAGPVFNATTDHYYYLLSATNWSDSEAAAVSLGGHLVTINDAAENNWVFDTFNGFGGGNLSLWIGFTDQDREGTFVWVSGEPITYTGWGVNEPNNGAGGPVENCAYICGFNSGQATLPPRSWNDGYGAGINGVVEVTGVPTLMIVRAAPDHAAISWTPATPGFVLQESLSLSPASWTNSLSGATNPIVVSTTLPKQFFRLFKP